MSGEQGNKREACRVLTEWLMGRGPYQRPSPCLGFLTQAERSVVAAVIGGEGNGNGRGDSEEVHVLVENYS